MRHSTKVRIKKALPSSLVNWTLLKLPFLYRTRTVYYESNLVEEGGIDDLLGQLRHVLQLGGDIVECGSSRCGTSIIMADFLRSKGISKRILACDSYRGFDPVEIANERNAGLTAAPDDSFTSTSLVYVRKKLEALGLRDSVLPIEGFFQDTLPLIEGAFCFGLIDCDLRNSLVYCAEWLWARLPSNGRIVFDDYAHPEFRGARSGVDSFVESHRYEIAEHGLLKRLYFVCKA
jgi:hypothetical protein